MPKDKLTVKRKDVSNRIYSVLLPLTLPNGQTIRHHLYTRFMGKKTELWFFGCGLGDQACIIQVGDAFLNMSDEGNDPDLGRVMISFGNGPTSRMSYEGDINVRWTWGDAYNPNWLEDFRDNTKVDPDIYFCASEEVLEKIQEAGLLGHLFPAGVGRFFKPLNLEREGLGYAGLNTKSPEMTNTILGPALERGIEWISKDTLSHFKSLPELNEWYNSKKILFGMDQEGRADLGVVPSRVFETLATGTPLIQYSNRNINKALGFNYPFQSSSYDETEKLIEEILEDYEAVSEQCGMFSWMVRSQHSYRNRLETIMLPALEDLK